MAGHSKWANIQHRKGRQDAKRGKLWTKIIREITVAARAGGVDHDSNPALRLAWDKATMANMPKDNIQRAISRGVGAADSTEYEEIRYEGYGIGGAAVIVDTMTDNRNRTVADVRHTFARHGGKLGQEGSVAFQFNHCGQFIFAPHTSEDAVMGCALDAGADDIFIEDEGVIEVICSPLAYLTISQAFKGFNLLPVVKGIIMKPLTEIALEGDAACRMQKLLDALDALDDTQEIYTSAVMNIPT